MCSTELLFCKNQRGSTCYPAILYAWDSTTDIFLWIFKFFSEKLFHKTAPYRWLWKAFICLECQIIIVFVVLRKDICPNVIGEIATVLKAVWKSHNDPEGTKVFACGCSGRNLKYFSKFAGKNPCYVPFLVKLLPVIACTTTTVNFEKKNINTTINTSARLPLK